MKISFLLYPTDKVKVDEDTSFWLMHELLRRGHRVTYFESRHLFSKNDRLFAYVRKARLDTKHGYLASPLSQKPLELGRLDVLFIRKEPPFDAEYLHSMQLLSLLKKSVCMINSPDGIAACNEKLFILRFREFITDTLVSSDACEIERFVKNLRAPAVVKPLDLKGGSGIIKTDGKDKTLRKRLKHLTRNGSMQVMAQRFIPHRVAGDKRILLLNGNVLGCFLRRPAANEFRANLGLGGSMHPAKMSFREKKMVRKMAPVLRAYGLYFVGLDVIAGHLSEINVTSPSGIPEMKQLYGLDLQKKVANFIEEDLFRVFARASR